MDECSKGVISCLVGLEQGEVLAVFGAIEYDCLQLARVELDGTSLGEGLDAAGCGQEHVDYGALDLLV